MFRAGDAGSTSTALIFGFLCSCAHPTGPPQSGACDSALPVAVEIVVQDSISRVSLADSASGCIQAGQYVAPLGYEAPDALYGGDRLGTYQVVIQRSGYRQWTRSSVVVSQEGPCGNVLPVQLTALLQRAS